MKKLSRDKRSFRRYVQRELNNKLSNIHWVREHLVIIEEQGTQPTIKGISENYKP